MTTLEPMAVHDGPGYQPVVATYTDDNTITMRRLPGHYVTANRRRFHCSIFVRSGLDGS